MSTFQNPFTTDQFNKAYDTAKVTWVQVMREKTDELKRVLALFSTNLSKEIAEEVGEIPASGAFASGMGEVEDIPLISDVEGDYIMSRSNMIGYRKIVSGRSIRANKYPELAKLLRGQNESLIRRMILDATHKFTFAGDGSYTNLDGVVRDLVGGDGVSWVNDAHVMNNGSSWDNLLGSGTGVRLAESTLADAEDMMADTFTHSGILSTGTVDTVITGHHAATRNAAKRLGGQSGQVTIVNTEASLNDSNVYQGQFKHIVLPYLATNAFGNRDSTKNRFWFAGDSTRMKDALYMRVVQMPTARPVQEAENKDALVFSATADYDVFHISGAGVVGAQAT
jgi:hypothetical protein